MGCEQEGVLQAEVKGEFHRYSENCLNSLPVFPHFIIHTFSENRPSRTIISGPSGNDRA